jgi:hypothetical protein
MLYDISMLKRWLLAGQRLLKEAVRSAWANFEQMVNYEITPDGGQGPTKIVHYNQIKRLRD